jgi:hypothetical protein
VEGAGTVHKSVAYALSRPASTLCYFCQTIRVVGFVSPELRHLALQNPSNAARVLLSNYRREYGRQGADAWLEHFVKAHAACVANFPEARQPYALKNYGARYCLGQTAQVIAVHTIALKLWAEDKRARPYGVFLEAACKACGFDIDLLPENDLMALWQEDAST